MESYSGKSETASRRTRFTSITGAMTLATLLAGDVQKTPELDWSAMFNSLNDFVLDTPEKMLSELKFLEARRLELAPVNALYPGPVPVLTEAQRRLTTIKALMDPSLTRDLPGSFAPWVDYRVAMQRQGYHWSMIFDHIDDREIVSHSDERFFNAGITQLCYREGAAVVNRRVGAEGEEERGVGQTTFMFIAKPSVFSQDIQPVAESSQFRLELVAEDYREALLLALPQVHRLPEFQELAGRTALPTGTEAVSRTPSQRTSVTGTDNQTVTFESQSISVQFCLTGVQVQPMLGEVNRFSFTATLGEVVPR